MSMLRQITTVTGMNLRSIPERLGSSAVVVVGIMGVVGVLVSVLTLGQSLVNGMRAAGREDRAIVLRGEMDFEAASQLFIDEAQTIMNAPGVARAPDGNAAATADMVTTANFPRKLDGALAGLMVRGMSPQGFAVRPEIELVAGRTFTPGLRELIVGRSSQQQFDGLQIGDRVTLRGGEWSVVGVYASGNAWESMVLTDVSTLLAAYQRTLFSSVTVLLESAEAFDAFKAALTMNPTLSVDVLRETDYYAQQSAELGAAFSLVSYVIGGIMAAGALFAALNTMYSAVSARAVEIATLRAIGFGAAGVVVSVLVEGLILASLGGLAGVGISWLLLSGNTFSMFYGVIASSVAAQLQVTPQLLGVGFGWAWVVGLLGGLFPAIRAARLPVAVALRAL